MDSINSQNSPSEIDLTVSLINHSNPELLRSCLRSVYAATHRIRFDVCVVDNATDGRLVREIKEEFPAVRWIFNSSALGFSANHNQVLAEASGRYICILNDDTVVHDGAFDVLVEFMDAQPQIGMAGARILNPDGTIQNCAFRFMSLWSELMDICLLPQCLNSLKGAGVDSAQLGDDPAEVDWVLGACLIVRRQTLSEVGLLDDELSPIANTEEVDWCLRAHKRGWRVGYCPAAAITHIGGQSFKKAATGPDETRVEIHRTRIAFFEKHYGVVLSVLLRVLYVGTLPWNAFMLTQSLLRRHLSRMEYESYLSTHWQIALTSLSRCGQTRMESCR